MDWQDYDPVPPPIRIAELNETSTFYDRKYAAPADETLTAMWTGWGFIAIFVGTFVSVVFLAILCSKEARQKLFNMYVLSIMFPDIVFSLLCGITCLMNSFNGAYWSLQMCYFQQWYCVFGIGSNCWMNAIISGEIHKLLRLSSIGKRYFPPSRKLIGMQVVAVYLSMAFLGSWGFIRRERFPYHVEADAGLACLPHDVDMESSLFFWLVFFPLFAGIPLVYVLYVAFDVWRKKLLPPVGKRRDLAIYGGRIVFCFSICWVPYFLLVNLAAAFINTWVIWAAGAMSHLQGLFCTCIYLLKSDIFYATKRFVTCKCCVEPQVPAPSTRFFTPRRQGGVILRWSWRADSSQPRDSEMTSVSPALCDLDDPDLQEIDESAKRTEAALEEEDIERSEQERTTNTISNKI